MPGGRGRARAQARSARGAIDVLRATPTPWRSIDGIGFATADALAQRAGHRRRRGRRACDAGLTTRCAWPRATATASSPRASCARAARLLGVPAAGSTPTVLRRAPGRRRATRVLEPRMDARSASWRGTCAGSPGRRRSSRSTCPRPGRTGDGRRPDRRSGRPSQPSLEHRLSILTGLPGTGKTATMRALVDAPAREQAHACGCARRRARRPGASARPRARRRRRSTACSSGRRAGLRARRRRPARRRDVLVVDEASMLDVRLAAALLRRGRPAHPRAARRRRRPARAGRRRLGCSRT